MSSKGSSKAVGSERILLLFGDCPVVRGQNGRSEDEKGRSEGAKTYESKIPNDMDSGSLLSSSGESAFLEHIVRPEISLYVVFGRRASTVKCSVTTTHEKKRRTHCF